MPWCSADFILYVLWFKFSAIVCLATSLNLHALFQINFPIFGKSFRFFSWSLEESKELSIGLLNDQSILPSHSDLKMISRDFFNFSLKKNSSYLNSTQMDIRKFLLYGHFLSPLLQTFLANFIYKDALFSLILWSRELSFGSVKFSSTESEDQG